MGSSASVSILEREQAKPIDASDIPNGDFLAARNELIRMRELLAMVDCHTVADRLSSATQKPNISEYESLDSTSNRKGGIPRTPPQKLGTTTSTRTERDPQSFNESPEGQEFWGSLSTGKMKQSGGGLRFSEGQSNKKSDPATVARLLNQIRTKIYERFDSLREAFLKIDIDRSGYISRAEFRDSFAVMGVNLTEEEFEAVDHTYAHKESSNEVDKGIGYLEFINLITEECRYVPGSGEDEAEGAYFGKTTQNTAYPGSRRT